MQPDLYDNHTLVSSVTVIHPLSTSTLSILFIMRCTLFFTLIAAVSSVVAAPLNAQVSPSRYAGLGGLSKRNCAVMPSKIDNNMVDRVYKAVRKVSKEHKVMVITFATCLTESYFNNLDCGDQDSLGLFQQRPSKGWGTPAQLQNPEYATNKFLESLMPIYRDNSGLPANVLAQRVQRAEAGDQYARSLSTAERLIREASARAGNSNDDSNDDDSEDKPTSTKTATQTGNGGVINVGGKPTDAPAPEPTSAPSDEDDADCDDSVPECEEYDVPVLGDNCYKVSERHNLTLEQFYQLNPELDETCQNLYAGKQYCVAASDIVKRSL